MRPLLRPLLLASCATLTLLQAVPAAAAEVQAKEAAGQLVIPSDPASAAAANPSGKTVSLTVPLRESGRYLGDLLVDIEPNGDLRVASARVIDLLSGTLGAKTANQLKSKAALTNADLAAAGIKLRYNAQELALDAELASELRAVQDIEVSALDPDRVGTVLSPARFSGFLNARSNFDFLHSDGGFQSPVIYLDGAMRLGSMVAESEGLWQPGGDGPQFTRAGSRLVLDDRERLIRWTAGDLQPLGRGYQAVPEIAGLSVFRSYGVLEPQRIARPRGGRAFVLTRPSTVEVLVNGQLVRRLQLGAGNYDLRDFPFTQGANDVRLLIRDDAGRSQALSFNIFLDQNQLGSGLTEFGLYAGVLASSGLRGPDYSGSLAASGFIRRGISDRVTLGANFQGDKRSQMGGLEGVWASPLGSLAGTFALSNINRLGTGSAALVTFQRLIKRDGQAADALNLFVERRSANFGVLGTIIPVNPFAWEAGGGYSRALSDSVFAGIDGRYSRGRGEQPNVYNARGTFGLRVSGTFSLAAEARWEKDNFDRRFSGLITATWRLGSSSNARAEYDTRFDRARLSYSTFHGYGVGSYNITGDVDHGDGGSGANITANYLANRAELGFSHFGSFDNLFGQSLSQRSSLRVAGSVAFADGAFSVGRPVYDSFAIVREHRSLKGASVEVEKTPFGYVAETGVLGTAVHPALASYLDRTIAFDAPSAPVTADLGQGSFRVYPAYRSGYLVTAGSSFNVTAVGRLLDANGKPLSLESGTARQQGGGDAQESTIFTNREGRFGATGLGPGTWVVRMNDEKASVYTITIAEDAEGVLTVGELKPTQQALDNT